MKLSKIALVIGLSSIFLGFLFLIEPNLTGFVIVPKDSELGKKLIGNGIFFLMLASFTEIEGIKKYMEKRHKTKLGEVDVLYSDLPCFGAIAFHTKKDLSELYSKYGDLLEEDSKSKLKRLIESGKIYKSILVIPRDKESTKIEVYKTKWHEMGHLLEYKWEKSQRLPHISCDERVSIAYEFKGLLLAMKDGKFTPDEVKESIKDRIDTYKQPAPDSINISPDDVNDVIYLSDSEKRSHEKYMKALNFLNKFDPEQPIDESIKYLDKKIDEVLKERTKVSKN